MSCPPWLSLSCAAEAEQRGNNNAGLSTETSTFTSVTSILRANKHAVPDCDAATTSLDWIFISPVAPRGRANATARWDVTKRVVQRATKELRGGGCMSGMEGCLVITSPCCTFHPNAQAHPPFIFVLICTVSGFIHHPP